MNTLYIGAQKAVRPWNSVDAGEPIRHELPQQKIEICLCCPLCADSCDFCDGNRFVKQKRGRRKADVDTELLREMLVLRKCNREMCAALNVSKATLTRYKKQILKEEGN